MSIMYWMGGRPIVPKDSGIMIVVWARPFAFYVYTPAVADAWIPKVIFI